MSKTEESLIAAAKREFLEECDGGFTDQFEFVSRDCESAIERVLLAQMITNWASGQVFGAFPDQIFHFQRSGRLPVWPEFGVPYEGTYVFPQQQVGNYRVDFMIVDRSMEGTEYLAVECDGHDFHERTKEQARRDRSRDRWLLRNGIRVLRFTGSEIWADPAKCVTEIDEQLYEIAKSKFP